MAKAKSIHTAARARIKPLPAQSELLRLFIYEPDTGILRWRIRPNPQARRIHPGAVAGTVRQKCGYLAVGISRSYFYVHRIVWKMQAGIDPVYQIDHRDCVRLNNRWDNLREADDAQNMRNTRLNRNNRSGMKGVCFDNAQKRWKAYITAGGAQTILGHFKSFDDACAVRKAAAEKLHGEYSRAA